MSDAETIHQTLTLSELPAWQKSALVLGQAFEWCHAVLDEASEDRVNTLKGLTALAHALSLGVNFLNDIVPLIEQSLPGPTLQEALQQMIQKIKVHEKQISELQSDVAALEEAERKYQLLEGEQEYLEKRQKELNRICQFDEKALEDLRHQVMAIEQTTVWLADVENLENRIATLVPNLIVLKDGNLKLIQEQTRDKLLQAQKSLDAIQIEVQRQKESLTAESEKYSQAQQELRAAQERYKEVTQELAQLSQALTEYAKADRLVANSLSQPSAVVVRQSLEQIENSLKSVDELLAQAIVANSVAQQIQMIPL